MKKKGKNETSKKIFFFSIALLLFLNFLAHRVWFNPFVIISNGDWFYMFPDSLQLSQTFSWISAFPQMHAFGGPNVLPSRFMTAVIGQLVAHAQLNEQVLNMLLFFIPSWVVLSTAPLFLFYYLTRSHIAAFIGSVFYMFSTLFLVNAAGGYPFVLVYAFVPLIFLIFIHLLENFSVVSIVLFSILTAYLNIWAIHLMFIVYGICFLYAVFWLFYSKSYKNLPDLFFTHLKKIILFITLLIFSNFYLVFFSLSESIKSSVNTGITSRALIIPGYLFLENAITSYYPFWTGTQPTMFFNQPIRWYFWFIPLYVFASVFFAKKNKHIVFFVLLAVLMIFLGKGPSEPFGKVYEFAYDYIPLFNIYREASKFWIGIVFSYAVLLAYFVSYMLQLVEKTGKRRKLFFGSIILLPLVTVIFLSARPAFTTAMGPGYTSYEIPSDYKILQERLTNDKSYYRALQVPSFSRLLFFSEIHPRLSYNDLPPHLQTLLPSVLRLFSVGYVILPSDPYYDVFPGNSSASVFQNGIEEHAGLQIDKSFPTKEVKVYKNTYGSMPHVYATNAVNEVSGEMKSITDVYPLFSNQKTDFYQKTQGDERPFPLQPAETISLSSCNSCLNTSSSESAEFSSFDTAEEGVMEVFVKKYGLESLQMYIDGEQIYLDATDPLYYRSSYFLPKGTHRVFVKLQRANLLADQQDILVGRNETKKVVIPEEKLREYTPYTFAFEYELPSTKTVKYVLNQNTDFYFQYQQNKPGGTSWKAARGEFVGDGVKKQFTTPFSTLFNPEWIELVLEDANSKASKAKFSNFSFVANSTPQIIFKQTIAKPDDEKKLPNIIFQQINPTKYMVHVRNAQSPYILVLTDSYNKNWEAFVQDSKANLTKDRLLPTSINTVKEVVYKNDIDFFNLFSTKSSGSRITSHGEINGFANGWYIDKKGTYSLLLEFKPQKEYMIGIFIACFTIACGVIFLLIKLIVWIKTGTK